MNKLKKYFPIFENNSNVIYLDSAASSQKPIQVIETMDNFYKFDYANIHRGLYKFSEKSSELYDEVRKKISKFINAKSENEIIFTKGATDSLNLLANSISCILHENDEIIVSEIEHHSNLLPWKNLEKIKNIKVRYLPILDNGEFDYDWLKQNISKSVKLICVTGQSNVLGIKNNIKDIVKLARTCDAKVVVDASQLVAHEKIDVIDLDIDFMVFSGHKIYGPTGIGILYGKFDLLDKMSPYQFGGDMVESVSLTNVVYKQPPSKFEAGTPPIAEVIGLGSAIDFLNSITFDFIEKNDKELSVYAKKKLLEIDNIKIISGIDSSSIISFYIDGISSFDVGYLLGQKNICVRVGKHCAEPLHNRLGIENSIRISFGIYNTIEDIDIFISSLKSVIQLLK